MTRAPGGNARVTSDLVYDPDPHGAQLFHSLARRINGTLNGARPVTERVGTSYGLAPDVQNFRGQNAALGAARVYAAASPTMQDQISAGGSLASSVFAGRMARGTQ